MLFPLRGELYTPLFFAKYFFVPLDFLPFYPIFIDIKQNNMKNIEIKPVMITNRKGELVVNEDRYDVYYTETTKWGNEVKSIRCEGMEKALETKKTLETMFNK